MTEASVYLVAQVAKEAPHAIRLSCQLFDIPPCPKCDYIKKHCRCGRLFTEEELPRKQNVVAT